MSKKKTHDEFINEVYALVGDKYKVLGKYESTHVKIIIQHNVCGYKYPVEPNSFLHGSRCPQCAGVKHKTHDEFIKNVYELEGDNYIVLDTYINNYTKIMMQHIFCGYNWGITSKDFLIRGHRCPNCSCSANMSKSERVIKNYLESLNIFYDFEIRIDDCRNVNPLPFDFAIYNEIKNILLLIEADGRQHYDSVKYWGGDKKLEYVQNNDKIKTQYCKDNNIPLLRIPYWDFNNIESILNKELNKIII